ncbi:MAG: hypothetical protein ACYC9J_09005 [Sulfuricaulis sp.]
MSPEVSTLITIKRACINVARPSTTSSSRQAARLIRQRQLDMRANQVR